MGTLAVAVAPSAEPLTLAEARDQCRIMHTLHDAMLAQYIMQGREWAQGYTRRVFSATTYDLYLDSFPTCIELPVSPVQSITSVKYYDTAGVEQTLSAGVYESRLTGVSPTIRPKSGQSWPLTATQFNAVTVRFVAGYASTDADLIQVRGALRLYVEAHYHADNFDRCMAAAVALLDPLRVVRV